MTTDREAANAGEIQRNRESGEGQDAPVFGNDT